MSDSTEKFVPLNVRIPKSQKEKMQKLNFNFSAFTRAALTQKLINYDGSQKLPKKEKIL
jgi:post-segregation antitoxin (ccd killing protein)